MQIFIDTNVFYQNWHLKSANFQLLINLINNSGARLLMSNLVCEEVQNKQEVAMQEISLTLQNALKAYSKTNPVPVELDVQSLSQTYSFKNLLIDKVNNLVFFGYQEIQQQTVVHRAIK